jgi:hypothetical protein
MAAVVVLGPGSPLRFGRDDGRVATPGLPPCGACQLPGDVVDFIGGRLATWGRLLM